MFSARRRAGEGQPAHDGRDEGRERTDQDDVVVELALVLGREAVRAVHLGHLLKRVKDGVCDALVRRVDDLADLQAVGAHELALKPVDEDLRGGRLGKGQQGDSRPSSEAGNTHGEELDEGRDALALLGGELGALDGADDL